jgi:plasmid rolling circle replication initiator protein Rep
MDSILGPHGAYGKVQPCKKNTLPEGYFLSDRSEKDKKWDAHRANSERVEDLYSESDRFSRLAERMSKCSTWLKFGERVSTDTGELKLKLAQASFCRVRHCPVCGWRRTLRNTARFFDRIPALLTEHPKARFLFLTLTVPNCAPAELRAKITDMNRAWQRLIQLKGWPAVGWVRTVEVTRGKDGSAHPHFHALLMVKPSYFAKYYITQEQWLQRWRDCMRDQSILMVDVRAVKPKIEGQELHAAVVETLKYSTKVTDAFADPQWLYDMTDQLHKLRFMASGGLLKDIFKENLTDEEMIAGDEPAIDAEDPQRKLLFTWRAEHGRYALKNPGL